MSSAASSSSSSSSASFEQVPKTMRLRSKTLDPEVLTEASEVAEEDEMKMGVGGKRKRKAKRKAASRRGASSRGSVGTRSDLVIKVDLEHDIRRIVISPEKLSLQRLTTMIQKSYMKTGSLKPGYDLLLKYMDDDGDWVTITDDTELTFVINNGQLAKLKVALQPKCSKPRHTPASREDMVEFASALQDNVKRFVEGMANMDVSAVNQTTSVRVKNKSSQTENDKAHSMPAGNNALSANAHGRGAETVELGKALAQSIPEERPYDMYTGQTPNQPQTTRHLDFSRREAFPFQGNVQPATNPLINHGHRGHVQQQQIQHIGCGQVAAAGSSNIVSVDSARLQNSSFVGSVPTTQSTFPAQYQTIQHSGGYASMGGAQRNGNTPQYGGADYTHPNQTYNIAMPPRNHN